VSVGLLAALADARVLVELLRETVRSIALVSQVFVILIIILLFCVCKWSILCLMLLLLVLVELQQLVVRVAVRSAVRNVDVVIHVLSLIDGGLRLLFIYIIR